MYECKCPLGCHKSKYISILILSIQPKIINDDKLLNTPNVMPIYYEIYITIQSYYAYHNKQN